MRGWVRAAAEKCSQAAIPAARPAALGSDRDQREHQDIEDVINDGCVCSVEVLQRVERWMPRQAARGNRRLQFTALLHHITPQLLMDSFCSLQKNAAAEVDAMAASPAIVVKGAFTGGPSQNFDGETETTVRVQNITNLYRGKHRVSSADKYGRGWSMPGSSPISAEYSSSPVSSDSRPASRSVSLRAILRSPSHSTNLSISSRTRYC